MHDQRDAAIPTPLREWLHRTRAAKAVLHAKEYRRTVINARETFDALIRTHVTERPEVALVRDDVVPGPDYAVPVRIYHPAPEQTRPVALFLHGGGHVAGSVAVYDPIARRLAVETGWIIVAVEYRLAPECPYPAAVKDSMACAKGVFRCLAAQGLRFEQRLALIGDSGGGALCATLSHLAQYEPAVSIAAQVLIYPSLDYSLSQPSVIENGEGWLLERERILWLFDSYLQGQENRRAVSPLFMDLTEQFPRTLVVTAEFDPLRDEGHAYVGRLRAVGLKAEYRQMPGMVHAFLNLADLVPEACNEAYEALARFLNDGP
ncbi:alpha/beta hydrolase [uncultured Thiohalocapsa sp.]|uniref:alpha/beta hydrolase n=1 Tax=uncultured Thiohalocapsa sp. TaxID=768990 RepID=UPI0025E403E5|nr:alpha/beta hydrolase [uncultured Thiohalocapsa sp.]